MSERHSDTDGMATCSFCSKDSQEVRCLIAGKDDVYICNECVAKCSDERVECSFCFKKFHKKDVFIASEENAYICDECVTICSNIVTKHKNVHQESVGNQQHE